MQHLQTGGKRSAAAPMKALTRAVFVDHCQKMEDDVWGARCTLEVIVGLAHRVRPGIVSLDAGALYGLASRLVDELMEVEDAAVDANPLLSDAEKAAIVARREEAVDSDTAAAARELVGLVALGGPTAVQGAAPASSAATGFRRWTFEDFCDRVESEVWAVRSALGVFADLAKGARGGIVRIDAAAFHHEMTRLVAQLADIDAAAVEANPTLTDDDRADILKRPPVASGNTVGAGLVDCTDRRQDLPAGRDAAAPNGWPGDFCQKIEFGAWNVRMALNEVLAIAKGQGIGEAGPAAAAMRDAAGRFRRATDHFVEQLAAVVPAEGRDSGDGAALPVPAGAAVQRRDSTESARGAASDAVGGQRVAPEWPANRTERHSFNERHPVDTRVAPEPFSAL